MDNYLSSFTSSISIIIPC